MNNKLNYKFSEFTIISYLSYNFTANNESTFENNDIHFCINLAAAYRTLEQNIDYAKIIQCGDYA